MAKIYTWIGARGTAACGSVTADCTPAGSPQAGDTGIVSNCGIILTSNGRLNCNTPALANGVPAFAGDTVDRQSVISRPPAPTSPNLRRSTPWATS
jgi:hypothetical protein